MNAEAEAALQGLVDRAMNHMERTHMDVLDDIRHNEKVIRSADAAAHAELRKLRDKVDTAQQEDVEGYAAAMAKGQAPPKPTAAPTKERIRDLELRVIPGCDESLWLVVLKTRQALEPVVDTRWLERELRRWAKPKAIRDPSGVLPDPHGKPRPADVVDWVIAGIDRVARAEEEQRAKEEKADRQRAAQRKLDRAQAAYNREQDIRLQQEEETMAPSAATARRLAAQSSGAGPWPPFDRHAFLKREGLLDDYGYVQPGMAIQSKGGRERPIEQVPAEDLMPVATEA